ncbi:MAG: hypothetical protein ACEPOW_00805 [Bacteroidales bacterium]
MKIINRDNYEEHILDYLEGTLSPSTKTAMDIFLSQNLDLKNELIGIDEIKLTAEEKVYKNKFQLKRKPIICYKNITEDNYEDFFISYHEKILTAKEQEYLYIFLNKNPILRNDFQSYRNVFLKKEDFICPNKEDLKRKQYTLSHKTWITIASVAAMIFLFFNISIQDSPETDIANILESKDLAIIKTIPRPENTETTKITTNTPKSSIPLVQEVKSKKQNTIIITKSKPKTNKQVTKRSNQLAYLPQIENTSVSLRNYFLGNDLYYRYTYQNIYRKHEGNDIYRDKTEVGRFLCRIKETFINKSIASNRSLKSFHENSLKLLSLKKEIRVEGKDEKKF